MRGNIATASTPWNAKLTQSTITLLNDTLRAERQSFDELPVVDLAPLLDGSDPQKVAGDIRWALANVGFMYVKKHDVPQRTLDIVFEQARAFFELPLDEKMKLHIRNSGTTLRGYIEIFGENTNPTMTRDLRECFGASGQAWRCQRVQFPHRQGERAAPPGIEPWTHGGELSVGTSDERAAT